MLQFAKRKATNLLRRRATAVHVKRGNRRSPKHLSPHCCPPVSCRIDASLVGSTFTSFLLTCGHKYDRKTNFLSKHQLLSSRRRSWCLCPPADSKPSFLHVLPVLRAVGRRLAALVRESGPPVAPLLQAGRRRRRIAMRARELVRRESVSYTHLTLPTILLV